MRKLYAPVLFVLAALLALPFQAGAQDTTIADTVLKMPLEEGVSMDDAIDSMKLRAIVLNFKLVAHLPLCMEAGASGDL